MNPFADLDGIVDAHMHVYEEGYPLAREAYHQPEPGATAADYAREMARVGIARGVVVQPTAYGADNSCTLSAIAALAPNMRGVAMLDPDVTDAEIARLDAGGIVGARYFMLTPHGVMNWANLQAMAPRLAPFGWHIDACFYSAQIAEHLGDLLDLPVDLVIEHFGIDIRHADSPQMATLLKLIDRGRTWVKLSSPYGVGADGVRYYKEVDEVATALIAHAPDRCIWGSNWPHAGFKHLAPEPDSLAFLNRVAAWTADPAVQRKVLVTNAGKLYRFGD